MAIHVIPEAQPASDGVRGRDAQANPADYRLSVIHDQTAGQLTTIRWAQFIAGFSGPFFGATILSVATDFNIPTLIAGGFFAGVLFFSLRTGATESREVLTTVNALEYMKDSQKREIEQMNGGLVRLHQRNLFLERKLAAGEADGDDNGGPSASNLRFIPHRGRIN